MKIYGPMEHWYEEEQCYTLHNIPMLPYPQCLAEKYPDIQVVFDEYDKIVAECDPDGGLENQLPAEHPWLFERIV